MRLPTVVFLLVTIQLSLQQSQEDIGTEFKEKEGLFPKIQTTLKIVPSSPAAVSSPKPAGSSCKDLSSSCKTFEKAGFCKSRFYTTHQKKRNCAKTCGLC
ncbi:hypothetical protein QR680_013977 [Steinernema hermaphroditum]|uniref:ShKT domain-containing protein n=1 Tax=Steinernema hermaphroditum TaxID=289476 RepID=A0AA39I9X0_9BILA|nr:hypothetical protein QR680_013977 [Steinernema hermaphroditum]